MIEEIERLKLELLKANANAEHYKREAERLAYKKSYKMKFSQHVFYKVGPDIGYGVFKQAENFKVTVDHQYPGHGSKTVKADEVITPIQLINAYYAMQAELSIQKEAVSRLSKELFESELANNNEVNSDAKAILSPTVR